MKQTVDSKSILQMAMGAIEERVDYEMSKVIDNIIDPNTKATDKRQVTVTLDLKPDDERRTISVSATAKSKLAVTNPVATSLYVTADDNGEMQIAEMVPQIPGQMNVEGTEQSEPCTLKLLKQA